MSDFSALKPYLDINKFSPQQLTELQRGLDLDLDFFTYANPAYSAEEMLIYRTFLETAMHTYWTSAVEMARCLVTCNG